MAIGNRSVGRRLMNRVNGRGFVSKWIRVRLGVNADRILSTCVDGSHVD